MRLLERLRLILLLFVAVDVVDDEADGKDEDMGGEDMGGKDVDDVDGVVVVGAADKDVDVDDDDDNGVEGFFASKKTGFDGCCGCGCS